MNHSELSSLEKGRKKNQWYQKKPSQTANLRRLIIGSAALATSILAHWGYQIVRTETLEDLQENAFLEVQQGVHEIDRWLTVRKTEVETLANTPVVQSMGLVEIDRYVQTLMGKQSEFFKYAIGFTNGKYYNSARRNLAKGSIDDRLYFKQAMLGNNFVSDPIISRTTGVRQVNIASPIWAIDDKKDSDHSTKTLKGVFIGSVAVDRVTTIVNQLRYGEGSYPFALNSEGIAAVKS